MTAVAKTSWIMLIRQKRLKTSNQFVIYTRRWSDTCLPCSCEHIKTGLTNRKGSAYITCLNTTLCRVQYNVQWIFMRSCSGFILQVIAKTSVPLTFPFAVLSYTQGEHLKGARQVSLVKQLLLHGNLSLLFISPTGCSCGFPHVYKCVLLLWIWSE